MDHPQDTQAPEVPLQPQQTPRPFAGARKDWRFVLKFIALSVAFWLLQLAHQFLVLSPGQLGISLVRASGLAGATFFGFALLSSSLFKWHPAWAKYWYVRRSFGVMGFVFVLGHVLFAQQVVFQWNLQATLFSLNPFENPAVFGMLAFPVFFLMAITSSDWAADKLGYSRWKALHRLVYFGYLFAVFHFLRINPQGLMNG